MHEGQAKLTLTCVLAVAVGTSLTSEKRPSDKIHKGKGFGDRERTRPIDLKEITMPQVVHVYDLAVVSGAPLVVRCTRLTSRMEIQESCETAAECQGIEYSLLTPTGFGKYTVGDKVSVPPSQSLEPIVIAGYKGDNEPHTVPIGNGGSGGDPVGPGGPATLGTVVFQATSASASTTKIAVTEYF